MAVLSDQNLASYRKELDILKGEIDTWGTKLSEAERYLTSGTGNEFRTKYTKGKKASDNIQKIIDILQGLKKDFNTLISDANAFYQTSMNAAKK